MQVRRLTEGRIRPQLIRLAAPIIGTSFIQMLYNFTDMAWLGRLGSKEVAAVGVVGVLMWLAQSLSTLVKTGSEVLVSQSIGADDIKKARSYSSHSSTFAIIIGAIVGIGFLLLGPYFIRIYYLEESVYAFSLSYLKIVATATIPFFLSVALSGIYNATGHTKIPFVINSIGLIANIILDPLLIFLLDLGTNGAAIATAISETLVCVLLLLHLFRRSHLFGGFSLWITPKRQESKALFKIGLPVALLNSLFVFVNVYMGRLISSLGGEVGVAVLTTGGQLEAVTWNASQAFGTALSTFVGQNYAAKKIKRIFDGYKTSLSITALFGLFSTILFFFWGEEFFSLIIPDTKTFIEGGVYLKIAAYSQMFMMLEITTQGLFYGVGRSSLPASISIIGNYLRIPLAFLLIHYGLGLSAIWWAISLSSILKGIVSVSCLPFLGRKLKQHSL